MISYKSISEVFDLLNNYNISYLVLRNYENLLEPDMYLDGHGDIDLLCSDSQEIVRILDAQTDRVDQLPFKGDGIHYYIIVAGEKVSLDLRYVGDDYYCAQWESDLLERRILHDSFYVMNDEDYFYTLIYHAVLQKRSLSEEYLERLSKMARIQGVCVPNCSEKGFLRVLETYMRQRSYYFTYPLDYFVPVRFHLVNRNMVVMNRRRWFRHQRFMCKVRLIELLVWIKHKIQMQN